MNIKQLKEAIKGEIRKVLREFEPQRQLQPVKQPSKPHHEPDIMEPGVKEPDKQKRRTLTPNRETTPNTKPKASLSEDEKEIVDRITKRFKELSND